MNKTKELLEYLSRPDTPNSILLAPKAPPVSHIASGIDVALPIVMDAGDIYDTVEALALKEGPEHFQHELGDAATFSYSLPKIGRVRVHFHTQRGSKIARLDLVPVNVPKLDTIVTDPISARNAAAFLATTGPGVLMLSSPVSEAVNRIAYALLQAANEEQRRVIYILERSLSYLMPHAESIVIQAELQADMPSMEDGLSSALHLEPDIVYIGDLRPHDDVPSICHAMGSGVKMILGSTSMTGPALLKKFGPEGTLESSIGAPIPIMQLRLAATEDMKVKIEDVSQT